MYSYDQYVAACKMLNQKPKYKEHENYYVHAHFLHQKCYEILRSENDSKRNRSKRS